MPYDVTGRLDESLLFNGAGMVQFKPYFRGVATPPHRRLITVQKCVRTGDIEDVGDSTHLTFFEMLGNFSFGDYFKKEAIAYSWEFLTSKEWLGLDPSRLAFTVFTEDDESYSEWSQHVSAIGIEPSCRIFRLGEDTNYWPAGAYSAGPPGPCGPNSEMFYWTPNDEPPPSGAYSAEDYVRDEKAGKWLEIWNDVFIQYEWQGEPQGKGWKKTGMPELPFRSIDTGMGLERTATVLSGQSSVYETDAFRLIISQIESLVREGGRDIRYGDSPETDIAIRVIADHIRTATFCIADGILPANNGRGYVLRRLIRRGVLKGQRVLGFTEPFFHRVAEAVFAQFGEFYSELGQRRDVIVQTLEGEEELFRRTLAGGMTMLFAKLDELEAKGQRTLEGDYAFRLYDTYGFPFEVTKELCEERGVEVDSEGYDHSMSEAQVRSRGASGMEDVYGGVEMLFQFAPETGSTAFVGYEYTEFQSPIVGAIAETGEDGLATGNLALALATTPFYAESGGQVGDTGHIVGSDFDLEVIDMVKTDGVFVHLARPLSLPNGLSLKGLPSDEANRLALQALFNKPAAAEVSVDRRNAIRRNHTATHLLHAALRKTLGNHVTQAGSLVAPNHLRFDFTHGKAIAPDELAEIERMVNEEVLNNTLVFTYVDIPIEEARERGAMALFGEKYAERVRMVEIGEFSRELCGGTHVQATGEIGLFKILSENSAASGVRRIEATTGMFAYDWMQEQIQLLRSASSLLKSQPKELLHSIERTLELLKEERKKREKLASQGASTGGFETMVIGAITLVTQKVEAAASDAKAIADRLADGKPSQVTLVAAVDEGKLTFVCKVGEQALAAGAHAGNLLREVAKIAGGGGGGRAEFATAGGPDASKVDEALAQASNFIG